MGKLILVKNEEEEYLEPTFIFDPFGGTLLHEQSSSEFDKKIQNNMSNLPLDQLMHIVRDSQNYLFSKPEKNYKEGKNKSNSYDEAAVLAKLGKSYYDVKTLSQSANPEEELVQSLVEESQQRGKKGTKNKSKSSYDKKS